MSAVPIYRLEESFYVPEFAVTVRGHDLPFDVVRDVSQVTFTDAVGEIESFDLVVANWDAGERKFKYIPPLKAQPSSRGTAPRLEGIFDPGSEVELSMGYHGNLSTMLKGEITTLEPSYPDGGVSTLSVRGLSVLHRLRTQQHTFSWTDKRDSDIAREMGGQPEERRDRPGFRLRVDTDPLPDEPVQPYVYMDNQYDIVFLLNRARVHGYELVLREEGTGGRTQQVLHFGPSQSRELPPTYELEWGKSLVSFQPTLSTAQQISEVEVRGWDRRTRRPIVEKASWENDRALRNNPREKQRMKTLAQAFGGRREVVTHIPVHTAAVARDLARKILSDRMKRMVTATGSTVGLPELRAGRKVQITGFGDLFDGTYFLTKTKHTIRADAGYLTEFECRREGSEENAGGQSG